MFSTNLILRTCSLGLAFALPTLAAPQGSDDCSSPTVIFGEGSFSYDSTSATNSSFEGGVAGCIPTNGFVPPDADVFFVWNAPCTGSFSVDTCGDGYDNTLGMHLGSDCSATCIAGAESSTVNCNSLDAEIFWTATVGQDYLIQVGAWSSGQAGNAGTINIALVVGSHPNDTCATPAVIAGTGSFPFDSTGACTSGFNGVGAGCSTVTAANDVFFVWSDPVGGDFQFEVSGAPSFSNLAIYFGGDCNAVCIRDSDTFQATTTLNLPGVGSGTSFLVQTGVWASSPGGYAGTLDVSLAPIPPGDTCADPITINGFGTFAFDATGSTDSGFDGGDAVTCADTASLLAPHRDIFYLWTAPCDDTVTVHNCPDGFDSSINVHLGSDCSATCIDGNDGATVNCSTPIESEVIWPVTTSSQYLIQVGNWSATANANFGSIEILSAGAVCPPPSNDDCSSPTVISGMGSFLFNNHGATTSGFIGGSAVCDDTNSGGGPTGDVFFLWTAPCDATTTVHNCGSGFDSVINVHVGSDCSATCLDGNDGAGVNCTGVIESEVIWSATTGQDYLIQIGGWGGGTSTHTFEIQYVPALANDTCATPDIISGFGTTLFDTTGACTEGFQGAAAGCATGSFVADVFFVWSDTVGGDVRFDTSASSDLTDLAVYLGDDCSATCISEYTLGGTPTRVDVFGVASFTSYLVQVGGWGAGGTGFACQLDIGAVPPPPANDDCSTPEVIMGLGTFFFDNTAATDSGFNGGDAVTCQPGLGGSPPEADVFYVWNAPCDGDYQVNTCNGPFDTVINVHVGSNCAATCLTGLDDSCGTSTELNFTATGGQDYLIQMGGWQGASSAAGEFDMIQLTAPCGPDNLSISCDPNSDHYAGDYVKLGTSSFGSGVGSDLHLEAIDGPDGEFGFFVISATATSAIVVFNGTLCLDAPTARYNSLVATNQGLPQLNSIGQFDAAGVLQNLGGNATSSGGSGYDVPAELPYSPPGSMILPGETWCFQLWYRDQLPPLPNPGSTANWSNVLNAQF